MRYAVLLDLRDPDLLPIGLVTEHDDAVRVHYAVDCGLKNTYRDPYSVQEPDGTLLRYEPGDSEYFGSVLNTLSRGFALNELAEATVPDVGALYQLYREKVLLPRAQRPVRYEHAALAYSYVVDEPEEATTTASKSQLCVAA